MCALRLECFTNDKPVSSKSISLFEGFESEKDIAFSKGVRSGAEAASKAFETEKIRSLAPILEAINDIGFSQIEARQAALNSLQPLIAAIMETALPACAAAGFGAEIVNRIMDLVKKLPESKISIFVPEDAVQSITAMLAPAKVNCEILADPDLGPLNARIDWGAGFEHLDISSILESIDHAVQEFFDAPELAGGKHA